ncbi:MAG: adenylate/guanylate cyclase domain-containing protein [Gallionella sp.]|nr:adenylate/guanylate cyclase domain-containing protein [Gallionella sp.]
MLSKTIFRSVKPFITTVAVVVVIGLLVFSIYFTNLGMQWALFLSGVLIASVISMASRASRAEWIITKRTAQLTLLKDKLETETELHKKTAAEHQQSLALLHQTEQAFNRLIPHQLLQLLERDSILDVKLGDQIERKLTIVFTDIRSFSTLSESMTPQENFNFLNSYLKQMEPVIVQHHGIIDKYIGDAILALFSQGADDALSGAIHMLEKLEEYNTGRSHAGYAPIRIGFGLNTGLVMVGTVGGENRMESTVIGDAVNVTDRIEESTKIYNTPLLISQNTLYDLSIPGKYDIRFLDRIRVKGKSQPLSIYEVFNNDPIKLRDGKRSTKIEFEKAVIHYHLKEVQSAKELFTHCIEVSPQDQPAQIYLERCNAYLTTGQHLSTGELNHHLEWKDEFRVGIESIDAAHKRLFDKTNEFISASIKGDSQVIREIFSQLAHNHMESISEEENLMRTYNYPFLETHLREHKRFIENYLALKEEIFVENCDLPFVSFRAQLLLFDWFTGHIAKSDRHAGRYLLKSRQAPEDKH